MQEYLFIGSEPRFYPRWEDKTFSANPGDVFQFDTPPSDGQWCLAPDQTAPVSLDETWFNTDTENGS